MTDEERESRQRIGATLMQLSVLHKSRLDELTSAIDDVLDSKSATDSVEHLMLSSAKTDFVRGFGFLVLAAARMRDTE